MKIKIFLGILLIAFIASGATGSYFYYQAKNALYNSIKQELVALAIISSKFIDGDKIENLKRPSQITSQEYKEIQTILKNIIASSSEFLYCYTMRYNKGKVLFVVDSPPLDYNGDGKITEDEIPYNINEEYKNPPDSLIKGFLKPTTDNRPLKDETGWTMSGYAPLYNSKGEGVGLVGIDMSLNRIESKLSLIKKAGLVSLGMSFLLALILSFYFSNKLIAPLDILKNAISRFGKGDLSIVLPENRKDEIGMLFSYFNKMVNEVKEKEILKKTFGKIVDKELTDLLIKEELRLGGDVIKCVVLFCDIRNFTSLTSKLPPTLLVSLLNQYFSEMVEVVKKHNGIIDKFIGDALLAVFGHPRKLENPSRNAYLASVDMIKMCDRINKKLGLSKDFLLKNHIGIHLGTVVAGNIGSPDRMEYTVIGSAVNISQRVQVVARKLNHRIVVTKEIFKHIPNKQNFESIGPTLLKGIDVPMELFYHKQDVLA